MFGKWFSKKKDKENENEEENKKIILELETQLKEANLKLNTFHREILEVKTKKINPVSIKSEEKHQLFNQKQIELFEKNLREIKRENEVWKEMLEKAKMEKIDSLLTPKGHKYRLPLEKLYSGLKYKETLEFLEGFGIKFIDQLKEEMFKSEDTIKLISEAHKIYVDLQEGKISFDIKVYLLKGERINKLYPKSRKLCTYLNDNYYEFADDIINFDFGTLLRIGFDGNQINEFTQKKDEYLEEFKVK